LLRNRFLGELLGGSRRSALVPNPAGYWRSVWLKRGGAAPCRAIVRCAKMV